MSGIKLSYTNGRTLTFSSDDYLRLREEFRIVGRLIGAPGNLQRKYSSNALPAFYNEYETKLMLEEKIAVLEDKTGLKDPPSDEVKNEFAGHQKKVIEELHRPYIESRLQNTKLKMDSIINGKRKKLVKSGAPPEELELLTAENILREETLKIEQSLGSESVYTQVPTRHAFVVKSQVVNDIPIKNLAKYKVFRDLWRKGSYVTSGDSFGCDFLAYPGDPMLFHASQTVRVIDPNASLDFKYLISSARLSVSVKKKCVFAYPNEDDSVTYQTITWDNPKLRELYANPIDDS